MPYTPPSIETDPDAVTTRILDGMADNMPGWVADEGAPEVALAEEIGRETAATNALAVEAINYAVAGFGETVFGIATVQDAPASIAVTVTVTGAGAVLPAGFSVLGTNPDGVPVSFTLTAPVTSTGTTVAVTMTAATSGTIGNGVPAGAVTITTATATAVSAVATAASTGGVDAEPITDYLDRLLAYTSTLRPGGVRASDVALLARGVAGVDRCLALDLYNPATAPAVEERAVTVFPITTANQPVTTPVANAVLAALAAVREVNFNFYVGTPTYTNLTITYTATAEADAVPATVATAVTDAVTAWLLEWGRTASDDKAWVSSPTVRYLDLARVIGSVDGVSFLSALSLNGGTADVTLTGAAALPAPIGSGSTITGTVTS
ncbi:hypothetical protein GCM10022215_17940 [Nocardioides fonticola]|uniref:Baseplate protein J-like barrel domain-containing protein n=1 Tax=Nocardioides fonticola TaxID=450363 RepID=A0ABP7XHK6_9ACTN